MIMISKFLFNFTNFCVIICLFGWTTNIRYFIFNCNQRKSCSWSTNSRYFAFYFTNFSTIICFFNERTSIRNFFSNFNLCIVWKCLSSSPFSFFIPPSWYPPFKTCNPLLSPITTKYQIPWCTGIREIENNNIKPWIVH